MTDQTLKVAVLQFPGSNCEAETARALASVGCAPEVFRWNRPAAELDQFQAVVIGGGFSYQDRVRAGAIAAREPICSRLVGLAGDGVPVLGICNGAQVLVETGLVPGVEPGSVQMALAPNIMSRDGRVVRRDYYCRWVHLKLTVDPGRCWFTRALGPDALLALPMAHGEGRFVTRDEGLLDALEANGQLVWRYASPTGEIDEQFPVTPNGSRRAVAGICNPAGNVLALMPHPERATWLRQVPQDLPGEWGRRRREAAGDVTRLEGPGPGAALFASLVRGLAEAR